MFGAPKSTFGSPASSAFGQTTSNLFGAASKPSGTLFGQPATGGLTSGGSSLFGGTTTQTSTLGWGATPSTTAGSTNGTSIPFQAPISKDELQRGAQKTTVSAKHMCITEMNEYRDKSLEELRIEDYLLGRQNGPTAATGATSSIFGASAAVKPFQFGTTQTTTGTSIFGQQKPANTLFGGAASSAFGGASPATQSLFGQQTQSQGGLLGLKSQFGTSQSTNLFGSGSTAPSSGFTFGQSTQSTSLFGGAKPLFGATSATPSAGTGIFGGTQPSTATSSVFGFGQTQPQQQSTLLGGSTNLFGQTATASKPGLFGTQPAATASVAPFGSTTTNLFGAPKTTAGTSFFGSSTGFGGQQQQQQTSGFSFGGQAATGTTGLFGTLTTSSAGGIFGQPANTGGTFGGFGTGLASSQTPALGGGFGSAGTSLFGQATPKKTFGFGSTFGTSTTTSTPSLFGQSTGLFGGQASAAPTLGFAGTTTAQTGTLFGQQQQQQSGFGFGQKTGTTGFGLGAGTGGLLGSTGTNVFGTGASALGGTNQTLGTGLGGFSLPGQSAGSLSCLASNTAEKMAQNIRAQQQVLDLVRSMPYGQSPLFRYLNMPPTTTTEPDTKSTTTGVIATKTAANALVERQKAAGLQFGPVSSGSPTSLGQNLRPRRLLTAGGRPLSVGSRSKLFSGFNEDDAFESPESSRLSALRVRRSVTLGTDTILPESPGSAHKSGFFVRRDEWKRLQLPENIRASILERSVTSSKELSQLAEASLTEDTDSSERSTVVNSANSAGGDVVTTKPATGSSQTSHLSKVCTTAIATSKTPLSASTQHPTFTTTSDSTPIFNKTGPGVRLARAASRTNMSADSTFLEDLDRTCAEPSVFESDQDRSFQVQSPVKDTNQSAHARTPLKGVRLTKPGYYSLPTVDELNAMIEAEGHCAVEDFVIGRRNYGSILFPGITELTNLNLDDIVHIRRREVVVYPDDEKKPPVGSGLNKRAEICLESIWPTDKSTHQPIKSPERLSVMRFEQRLERATQRMDARFIEYRPESGSWVFEVKHFSKYRLEDSDDEETAGVAPCTTPPGNATAQKPMDTLIHTAGVTHSEPMSDLLRQSEQDSFFGLPFGMAEDQREPPLFSSGQPQAPVSTAALHTRQPSLAVRQMRQAFFDRRSTGRSSKFGFPADETIEFEEAEQQEEEAFSRYDDYSEQEKYRSTGPPINFKRTPSDDIPQGLPFTTRHQDKCVPTPEKICRFKSPPSRGAHPKLEQVSDESDASIDYEKRSAGTTPFRPIWTEKISEGVPLDPAPAPPATALLHTLRIPAHLKCGHFTQTDNQSIVQPGVYPYFQLSCLSKDGRLPEKVNKESIGKIQAESTKTLSRLILDAGLWRGHGMRPSWGHTRTVELHATLLVRQPDSSVCGYSVRLDCWPCLVEQTDESLLNAALMTSNRRIEWTEDDSLHPLTTSLSRPSYHCPLWQPELGLSALEAYSKVLYCGDAFESGTSHSFSGRILVIRRLISLCLALWGEHPTRSDNRAKPEEDNRIVEDVHMSVAEETSHSPVLKLETQDFCTSSADMEVAEACPGPLKMMARKQAVSEWIRSQSQGWLESRLVFLNLFDICCPTEGFQSRAPAVPLTKDVDRVGQGILTCLLAGEPGAACRLALAASLPNLASLIAQSSASDPVVRRGLRQQLAVWHETQFDQHIPLIMLRIYALLAGQDHFPHPKHYHSQVWVLDSVDWIRALGAYLWYFTPYEASLTSVLTAYESQWSQDGVVIARPVPPRQCDLLEPTQAYEIPKDFLAMDSSPPQPACWPRDCAYQLLKLYCKQSHTLDRTLDPCSMSHSTESTSCQPDSNALLDWAPSWTIWRVLHALNFHHFASGTSAQSRLCDEFAAQLEDGGLWEWAIFVLLHHSDQASRDATVKNVLARHVSLVLPNPNAVLASEEEEPSVDDLSDLLDSLSFAPAPPLTKAEQFVVQLGVPVGWVHEAKAILAKRRFATCDERHYQSLTSASDSEEPHTAVEHMRARLFAFCEAAHWFAAGHYNAAHDICFGYLLPNIVLHTSLSFSSTASTSPRDSSFQLLLNRLTPILQAFNSLAPGSLPVNFDTGVGIYAHYADLLSLTERLSGLYQSTSNPQEDSTDDDAALDEAQSELSSVLNQLQTELFNFVEKLERMKIPNLISRVVKTEMATTCSQLIPAFLVVSMSGESQTECAVLLDRLQHQLVTMSKLDLPADRCLKELANLCKVELSMGVV